MKDRSETTRERNPGDIIAFSHGVAVVLHLVRGTDMPDDECCPSSREFDWFRVLRTEVGRPPRLGWLRADVIDWYGMRSCVDA